jgi:AcrR family transcriptional regulator
MSGQQTTLGRPPSIEAPRETILARAAELFARQGYEGTSLQQVASAVGMTKAAIYHYFPTKQSVYEAIVVDLLARLDLHVRGAVDATGHDARLRQMMIGHAEFFEANYTAFVTVLHGVSGLSRAVGASEKKVRDRYERFVRQVVGEGVEAGAFEPGDVRTIARAILSMLNWMSRWYRPGGSQRARDFAEEFFAIAYFGLKPRPAVAAPATRRRRA